jgi:hypothetical protein
MVWQQPEAEGQSMSWYHPNRVPFRGLLTTVEIASDRPPSGARGHRVLLTKEAANAAIPSLIGMALSFTPRFDGHDARSKVAIITSAELHNNELHINGYVFGRDFPEVLRKLRTCSTLGLSYEMADVRIRDVRDSVWTMDAATFTGAAILHKKKAAYENTWIELMEDRKEDDNAVDRIQMCLGASDRAPDPVGV